MSPSALSRAIAAALSAMPVAAVVFDARGVRDPRVARERALAYAVDRLAANSVRRLILEQDDSLVQSDRRVLFRATRAAAYDLEYVHARPASEPLLWIPDAIAWSVARGGDWARRISDLIDATVIVPSYRGVDRLPLLLAPLPVRRLLSPALLLTGLLDVLGDPVAVDQRERRLDDRVADPFRDAAGAGTVAGVLGGIVLGTFASARASAHVRDRFDDQRQGG